MMRRSVAVALLFAASAAYAQSSGDPVTDPNAWPWFPDKTQGALCGSSDDRQCWTFGNANTVKHRAEAAVTHVREAEEEIAALKAAVAALQGGSNCSPLACTSVAPSSGSVGAPVTLAGTCLVGPVDFNGASAGFSLGAGGTSVTTTVPQGASTGLVHVGAATCLTAFTVTTATYASITGTDTTVPAGASIQLEAAIVTDPTDDTTLSRTPVYSGATCGTVTADGLYQAPAAVPSGGTCTVTASTPGGALSDAIAITITAVLQASITNISPTIGLIGETVTIDGTELSTATAVDFPGARAVTWAKVSNTRVTAAVPTGATTGPITVLTADAGSATSSQSFTVVASGTPGVPGTPTFASVTSSGMVISWTAASGTVLDYVLQRSTDQTTWTTLATLVGGAESLAPDSGFPKSATSNGAGPATFTLTGVTTAGADRKLTAVITWAAAATVVAPTISGGGLTWAQRRVTASSQLFGVVIYDAWAATTLTDVTLTIARSTAAIDYTAAVWAHSGAEQSPGATGVMTSYGPSHAIAVDVAAVAAGSWIVGGFVNETVALDFAVNASTTWDAQNVDTGFATAAKIGHKTTVTGGAGTVTLGSADTGTYVAAAAVEILEAGSSGGLTYADSDLAAGTTYYYRVRAHNGSGNGAWSAVAAQATSGGGATLSTRTVAQWKAMFDQRWPSELSGHWTPYSTTGNGGTVNACHLYWLRYAFTTSAEAWLAFAQTSYVNDGLTLIEALISHAATVSYEGAGSHLGWPGGYCAGSSGDQKSNIWGRNLGEVSGFSAAMRLLRVVKDDPTALSAYQSRADTAIAWIATNVFQKWWAIDIANGYGPSHPDYALHRAGGVSLMYRDCFTAAMMAQIALNLETLTTYNATWTPRYHQIWTDRMAWDVSTSSSNGCLTTVGSRYVPWWYNGRGNASNYGHSYGAGDFDHCGQFLEFVVEGNDVDPANTYDSTDIAKFVAMVNGMWNGTTFTNSTDGSGTGASLASRAPHYGDGVARFGQYDQGDNDLLQSRVERTTGVSPTWASYTGYGSALVAASGGRNAQRLGIE
jgi:hypothetical protein